MRILIDTQIFIWAVIDSEKLSDQARQIMIGATEVFVSSASIWEIAIKAKLGKLEGNPNEFTGALKTICILPKYLNWPAVWRMAKHMRKR